MSSNFEILKQKVMKSVKFEIKPTVCDNMYVFDDFLAFVNNTGADISVPVNKQVNAMLALRLIKENNLVVKR